MRMEFGTEVENKVLGIFLSCEWNDGPILSMSERGVGVYDK